MFLLFLSSFLMFIPFEKTVDLSQFNKVTVDLNIGAFEINISPTVGNNAFISGEYDPKITDSVEISLEKEGGNAYLLIKTHLKKHLNLKWSDRHQALELKLPKSVLYNMDFSLGVVKGEIEFGGINIEDADLSIGAGDMKIDFSEPSPGIDTFSVSSGLADLEMDDVGNAGIKFLDVSSGLGRVGIDLRGEWKRDMEIEVSSGLQVLELSIPEELGLYLEEEGILNLKDIEGMEKAEGGYISENFDHAKHKIHVVLKGALNSIDLDWVKNAERNW